MPHDIWLGFQEKKNETERIEFIRVDDTQNGMVEQRKNNTFSPNHLIFLLLEKNKKGNGTAKKNHRSCIPSAMAVLSGVAII